MRSLLLLLLFCAALSATAQNASHWQKLNTVPYKGKQDDITFINRNTGWYVNGYGHIYHTTDGGNTWVQQVEQKGTFFRCIAFIDSLHGFAGTVGTDYFPGVTDSIPLYKTDDGGNTWKPVSYSGPAVKGLCALDIVKEQYINHGEIGYKYHIFGVGRVGSPAFLMVSHDGGNSFTSMDMSPYCSMLLDIKMFDKNEGFACAGSDTDVVKSHAVVLHTADGGKTWERVYESQRPYEITWKMSFPTRKVGYVTVQSYNPDSTIDQQRVAKTTNGGRKWKEVNLVNDYRSREFGVGFIDEKHGFVGAGNSGYETADGGKHWDKVDLGRACNKIRIYSDDKGTYGYAIGVNVFKME
jgi:photosystem II stability/assembly factor-like uncharacterized protein